MNDQEYGRPRRPKPDTVSYLNGLPLDENLAAQQAREYVAYFQKNNPKNNEDDDEPPEYPPMLSAAHAALSSIFHEFASLACEEIPSQQVETLVRICCRYSLISKRVILASMTSYWTFLSTHRFGSHVAQTVLRCVVAECEVNLDDFDDGQGDKNEGKMVIEDSYGSLLQSEDDSGAAAAVPHSLFKLLLESIEELKQYASDLAVHVCGSHVLRTSLCILSGVEFVDAFAPPGSTNKDGNNTLGEWDNGALAATRRGKAKDKKKKKKKLAAAPTDEEKGNSIQEVTVMKVMKLVPELQSDDFHSSAETLMDEMVAIITLSDENDIGDKVQTPGKLQQHICHPSAGPLIIQILRLLSHRDNSQHGSKKANSEKEEIIPDRRLMVLPQEPRYSAGSKAELLVHRLLCWDSKVTKQLHAGDIIYGLSGEPRGSVLLEAIFRCCSDSFHDELCTVGEFYTEATLREYIQHGVSNFVVQTILMTVRSKEQASRMIKCLCGIVEDGSILNINASQASVEENKGKHKNPRMGVVWRAVEMCATKGSSQDQEQILSALLRGYATVTSSSTTTIDDSSGRKKRSKAKGLSAGECIPHLLGLAPGSYEGSEGDNTRLSIDASGARILYHILQFKERLRKDWVKSILNLYSTEDLVKIANDGLGSRW